MPPYEDDTIEGFLQAFLIMEDLPFLALLEGHQEDPQEEVLEGPCLTENLQEDTEDGLDPQETHIEDVLFYQSLTLQPQLTEKDQDRGHLMEETSTRSTG